MTFREQGYIGSEKAADLKKIASDNESFSASEFSDLYQEVNKIYEEKTDDIRQKIGFNATLDHPRLITEVLTREELALYNGYISLSQMSVHDDGTFEGSYGIFLGTLRNLYGKDMWYEDKDFYLHAFDVLAEENANFASSLSFFKEDLQDLGTEIRLEQQHEADTAYTVVTEDGSANLRKQTRTFERKEYKGKDKQLMRNLLEEIDPTVWESEKGRFKDITDYLDDTNMPQLMDIFAKWIGEGTSELERDTLEDKLEAENYQPKGGKLGRKEKRNIVKLYEAFQEYGTNKIFSTNTTDPLAYLVTVLRSDVSLAHTIQSRTLTQAASEAVKLEDHTHISLLGNMIGDVNYDARLINAPDANSDEYINNYKAWEKAWKNVDAGIIMGTSLHEMMVDAEHALAMEIGAEVAQDQVIQNIAGALSGYTGNTSLMDVTTPEDLFQIYVDQPYLLAATHKMLLDAGADARWIMHYGIGNDERRLPSYTDMIENRAAQETVDIANDDDIDTLKDLMSEDQLAMIDNKLSDCFSNLVVTLEQQILDDPTLNTKALASFVSSLEQDQVKYENLWKLNTLGVMVSTIKGNEGIGLGTNVNVWLNDNLEGFIQRMTLSGGAFVDQAGNPAVGLALSVGANHNFGSADQHTFYYAGGVGAGLTNSGLAAGPFVSAGIEFQINKGRIEHSLDAKSAQHIGALVSASIGTTGGTLYWSRDKLKGYQQQKASIEASFSGAFAGIEDLDDLTSTTILKNLEQLYPNTDHDTLQQAARNMTRILRPFADRWGDMNNAVKGNILQKISNRYALSWYNQKVEHEARGLHISQAGVGVQWVAGFLLPTAGLGLSWYRDATYSETPESIAAIKKAQEEGLGARKVADRMDTDVARDINNLFGPLEDDEKIEVQDASVYVIPIGLMTRNRGNVNVHVHPAMKRFIKHENGGLHVHNDIPVTIMSTFRQGIFEYDFVIGSKGLAGTEQVLLRSESDLEGTTAITSFAGNPSEYEEFVAESEFATQSAKMVEAFNSTTDTTINTLKEAGFTISERTVDGENELVLKGPDGIYEILTAEDLAGTLKVVKSADTTPSYSYEIELNDDTETKFEIVYAVEQPATRTPDILSLKDGLLPKLSPEVKAYIEDDSNNEDFLYIRNGALRSKWKEFRTEVQKENWDSARDLLQDFSDDSRQGFHINPSEITPDDIRALDAAFSAVRLTQNKIEEINTVEQRIAKAKEYRTKINNDNDFVSTYDGWGNPSNEFGLNEDILVSIINGDVPFETHRRDLFHMLNGVAIEGNTTNYMSKISSPIYKLYWLLAPNKDIIELRDGVLKNRFDVEFGVNSAAHTAFAAARKEAITPIKDKSSYATEVKTGSYGMVLGFAEIANSEPLEEKFLPNPEIVKHATAQITDPELKKYFLDNLPEGTPILAKLVELTGGRELAIKAIIDGQFEDSSGLIVTITSTFSLGFYGKCCNETILLDDLVIDIPGELPADSEEIETSIDTKETFCNDGVRYLSAGAESIMHKEKNTVAVGWIGGDPTREEEREIIREEEGESSTVATATTEELNNNVDRDAVNFGEHEIVVNGETIKVMGYQDLNDPNIIYYADNDTGIYYKYTPGSPPTLVPDTEIIQIRATYDEVVGGIAGYSVTLNSLLDDQNNRNNQSE